jgi:DnaA family protein
VVAGTGRLLDELRDFTFDEETLRYLRDASIVDDAALDWLLRRVGRDLGGLARLFDRLDRASLAAQRRLTVPFLREALGDGG